MTIFLKNPYEFPYRDNPILNNIHIRIHKTIKIRLRLIFEGFVEFHKELVKKKRWNLTASF